VIGPPGQRHRQDHAARHGRNPVLQVQLGRQEAARAAFAEAASTIRYIARNIADPDLCQVFLSSRKFARRLLSSRCALALQDMGANYKDPA
jgi:hypothetical protein